MNDNRKDTWEPVGAAAARVVAAVAKAMEAKRERLRKLVLGEAA